MCNKGKLLVCNSFCCSLVSPTPPWSRILLEGVCVFVFLCGWGIVFLDDLGFLGYQVVLLSSALEYSYWKETGSVVFLYTTLITLFPASGV